MIIGLEGGVPRLPECRFNDPVYWEISEGEQWAVIGPNGAGKTLLADMLMGKYVLREGKINYGEAGNIRIKSIAFKDIYTLADCRNVYYQQRWHATETEEVPLVAELLAEYAGSEELKDLLVFFGMKDFLQKRLISLSSGELRKLLIVRILLTRPQVLILDNPFIGLDAASRILLQELFEQITVWKGIQVILLLSNPADIPAMITHVLPVMDKTCMPVCSRQEFLADHTLIGKLFPDRRDVIPVLPEENAKPVSNHRTTLRMEKVSICYGERTILKELDWEIKNGDKWALSGPNGSGKSTLLSLVYADNPQSYANTFYLFDRKRGSGESIWDIKRRIGYVSPEMHLYYSRNVAALRIVASGFFDSIGLYRKCTEEQEVLALRWMAVFGIEDLKDRLFLTLSSGEQRLVLLARAFVKDPDLLILDEPLHGLDVSNKQKVAAIIETFCKRAGKTLIYVTHYPEELPAVVDKKLELKKY